MKKSSRLLARKPFSNVFLTIAGALAGGTVLLAASDQAQARRATHPHQQKSVAKQPAPPAGPLTLVVSIRKQRVTVYGPNGKITDSPVSTGQRGHDTPTGVFSVIGKEVMHHSNLYGGAPMPYMNRITWSGVALHAGNLPGYPASHGCIRLPYGFSRTLYTMTKVGTRVIVAHDDVAPQPISHPLLFTPLPSENPAGLITAATLASSARVSDIAGFVPSIIGITPAVAAEHAGQPHHRTQQMVAAERAAEGARIAARIKDAEARRGDHEQKVRETADTAASAKAAHREAVAGKERLARDLRRAQSHLQAADAELGRLGRLKPRDGDNTELARAAEKEDLLEKKVFDATADVEAADAAVEAADGKIAEALHAMERAEAAHAAAVGDLRQVHDELAKAKAEKSAFDRAEANRAKPVTVLVSRKTGKVHVRQGADDLFVSPVTIAEPERPLGTHVFTAVALADGGKALNWNVVTAAGEPRRRQDDEPRRRRKSPPVETVTLPASTPAQALDRIAIPAEAVERIAELVKPGSTLMVSDYGISHETSQYTDYILLTR
jgi:hypothetical protein